MYTFYIRTDLQSIDRCAASAPSPLCFSVLMAPKTSTSFRCILFFVQPLIEQKIELKVIILFGTCIPTININTHEPMCLFSIRSPGQQRTSRRSSFPPSRFTDILVSWGGGRTVENLPHQRIIRIERTRIRRRRRNNLCCAVSSILVFISGKILNRSDCERKRINCEWNLKDK